MAKIQYSSYVENIKGQMGNVVYRKYKGQTLICRKPSSTTQASAAQLAHQQRFSQAAEFGNLVMADDLLRPLYEQAAAERELPVFALCIADFFNPPSVTSINPVGYTGKVGDSIEIVAHDDMGVVRVNVDLTDFNTGEQIESGLAVEAGAGARRWTYTATKAAAAGTNIVIQVTATDRPGGTGSLSTTKTI